MSYLWLYMSQMSGAQFLIYGVSLERSKRKKHMFLWESGVSYYINYLCALFQLNRLVWNIYGSHGGKEKGWATEVSSNRENSNLCHTIVRCIYRLKGITSIGDITHEIISSEVEDRCLCYQDYFEWFVHIPHKSPNFGKLLSPNFWVVKYINLKK